MTPTASPTAPPPTVAPTGTITGRFGYPSDFIPPLTVYAISVADPRVSFSVDFAGHGNPPRPTLPPGVSQPTYTLAGIAPGTYHVIAYRNDGETSLGVYSRHTVNCTQTTTPGQTSTPAPGCAANDHSLLPVIVRAGETVSRIDITDWAFGQQTATYPARPTRSAAPTTVTINGRAFRIDPANTVLWRDFMPVSPPDGRPLLASIRVVTADGSSFPEDVTAERVWVYGPSVWETGSPEVRRAPAAGTLPAQIEVFASEGPKWDPGTRVDVVVRLRSGAASHDLQISGVVIQRTT